MAHQTFDLDKDASGKWRATSHNFPSISVEANSDQAAIIMLNRAICHYRDNNPQEYKKNIKHRIKTGLECMCGHKLEEPAISIYTGTKIQAIRKTKRKG